jgi:drug/metabolite transporter (DMT)-like permease
VTRVSIPSRCLLTTSVVTILAWWAVAALVNPEAFEFGIGIFIPLFLYALAIGLVALLLVALVDLLRHPDRRTPWNFIAALAGLICFAVVYHMWGWGSE